MTYRAQIDDRGKITFYKDTETGEVISAKDFERRMQMQAMMPPQQHMPQLSQTMPMQPGMEHHMGGGMPGGMMGGGMPGAMSGGGMPGAMSGGGMPGAMGGGGMLGGMQGGMQGDAYSSMGQGGGMPMAGQVMPPAPQAPSPLVQPGANMLKPQGGGIPGLPQAQGGAPQAAGGGNQQGLPPSLSGLGLPPTTNGQQHYAAGDHAHMSTIDPTQGRPPTAGAKMQGKSLRMEGVPKTHPQQSHGHGRRSHGFLDATSVAILLPTLVLLALIIAAAHKKRLFPWQTIRTFNPPSGMLTPRDYEKSFLCPPNLRRHGRMGKRNPESTWTELDGVVIPFGFLARTHLPITIPMGRLPNKNMFLVAPSGSGKTTLMRAIIKSLLAKPCVIVALEAKANDPNLDEKKEGFKHSLLPEAGHAGFQTLYFNPLDDLSVHWNPLDLDPITFASSIVQDVNSLAAEEQHWAERDMGYIEGLAQVLKWGAVEVVNEDENGQASELQPLPCNPRGLMKLVNNRRNIVESLRQFKSKPEINATVLTELTQRLASIIRTDNDWDKNIQGVRGRLRMFKNQYIMRVTEKSTINIKDAMHTPTVLIFGAPASLGADAESLAGCFVYQLQNALHTRYGTKSVLPLFAFFDEYQTLNIDLAGRLSAIVRGANGGLTVILQNISQIASGSGKAAEAELRTIFSNSAIRVCLHNADEQTAAFFSEEIGKHAVIVPGIADHYQATGFGIFPTSWNRIHSQQVVARVDPDAIKRMEKQHALVYLAAASDPEFGETKPLMVDLRGIEEIARLHLLHNVSTRTQNAAAQAAAEGGGNPNLGFAQVKSSTDAINSAFGSPGPQDGEPPQGGPGGEGNRFGGQTVGQMAQTFGIAAQQVFGQILGKALPQQQTPSPGDQGAGGGERGMGGGRPSFASVPNSAITGESRSAGHSGGASRMPGFAGSASEVGMPYSAPSAGGPISEAMSPSQSYPTTESAMPGFAGAGADAGMGAMDGMGGTMPGAYAEPQASPAPAMPDSQSPASSADRSCPQCGKKAGKGKFCIECGQFIGLAASTAPTPVAPVAPAAEAPVPEAAPQPQPVQPAALSGSLGSRPNDPSKPQPRYGGLEITARANMPAKKSALFENASQIAGAAQGMRAANPYAPSEEPAAGPLSARTAAESGGNDPQSPYQRKAVTSFNPDVSKFGFNQPNQTASDPRKGGGGVEF